MNVDSLLDVWNDITLGRKSKTEKIFFRFNDGNLSITPEIQKTITVEFEQI